MHRPESRGRISALSGLTQSYRVAVEGLGVTTGGPTISAGGLKAVSTGATIAGGVTVSTKGLTVTTGGVTTTNTRTIASTFTVTNSASAFANTLLALVSPSTVSFTVMEATVGSGATSVFKVDSTGLTTTLGLEPRVEVQTNGASITTDNKEF